MNIYEIKAELRADRWRIFRGFIYESIGAGITGTLIVGVLYYFGLVGFPC